MGKKQDRSYSADFKESAVQLALRSPSLEVVAKELGVPKPTLYTWVTKFKKGDVHPKLGIGSAEPTLRSFETQKPALRYQTTEKIQWQAARRAVDPSGNKDVEELRGILFE